MEACEALIEEKVMEKILFAIILAITILSCSGCFVEVDKEHDRGWHEGERHEDLERHEDRR